MSNRVPGMLVLLLTCFGCGDSHDPRLIVETSITISGTVVDNSDQSPAESVLVVHEFFHSTDSSWTPFNSCLTNANGFYITGEPQTGRPSGRFLFQKPRYEPLILGAEEARQDNSGSFVLDATIQPIRGN